MLIDLKYRQITVMTQEESEVVLDGLREGYSIAQKYAQHGPSGSIDHSLKLRSLNAVDHRARVLSELMGDWTTDYSRRWL